MPSRRRRGQKNTLARRDGQKCFYCGHVDILEHLTIDHVTPVSKGGRSALWNLVLACKPCNTAKGDKTVGEWDAARLAA